MNLNDSRKEYNVWFNEKSIDARTFWSLTRLRQELNISDETFLEYRWDDMKEEMPLNHFDEYRDMLASRPKGRRGITVDMMVSKDRFKSPSS